MSKFIILGLGVLLVTVPAYIGYSFGKGSILLELEKQNTIVLELKEQNHKKELEYTTKIKDLENEIKSSKIAYSNSIDKLNKSSSDGLLKSKNRAEYYKRQAESCSLESRNLAEHTAKLDRQLTEGIYLVRELTELIKYRDKQLKQVGNQLKIDRELMIK